MIERSRREASSQSQPRAEDFGFDLGRALESIVALRSAVPEDAFTASILGSERAGSGVVIRESGLVLTIGYLITEAESVWLTASDGRVTPAHPLAYDQESGFGLVQALGQLDLPALAFGRASLANPGDPVVVAAGGRKQSVRAQIVAKQEFAGNWEYLLDEAIFTAPAHPFWGGAGVIDAKGRLLGVGSLHIQQADEGGQRDANMIVPIDLLPPILDDLIAYGRVNRPARPWLGVYVAENDDRIIVANVVEPGPAATAGLRRGDVITAVGDASVETLGGFYRQVWSHGAAGVEIAMEVVRDKRSFWLRIKSADRSSFLRKPRLH